MSPSWKVRSIQCWQSRVLSFFSFFCLDRSISSIFNAFVVFWSRYYLSDIYLVYSTGNEAKHSSSYNNFKTKTKEGHLISLPHSRFVVLVVKNPWRTLAFYFQSSLNCTVNYIPVLTTPRDFVEELFWKPSEGFPIPFVHCYRAITIVIPDAYGLIATATTMQKDDLRSVDCLSFETMLKSKWGNWLDKGERPMEDDVYPLLS